MSIASFKKEVLTLLTHRCHYILFYSRILQSWTKLYGQLRKRAFYLTPQAMYNQFKRPSARSVSELYYTYRKT